MASKIKYWLKKIFIEYYALVMILLFVADLVTKGVMEKALHYTEGYKIDWLPFFDFTLVYNQGSFAGMLGSTFGHILLILISVAGAAVMIYAFIKGHKSFNLGMKIGLAIAIPGDLGNLVDRCVYVNGESRGVIDFFHFHLDAINFDWPVFNVADICLVVGIICFAIFYIVYDVQQEKKKKEAMNVLEQQKKAELEQMKNGDKDHE